MAIAFSCPNPDRLRMTIGAVVEHDHLTLKPDDWYIIPKEWREETDATVRVALRRALDQHAVAEGLSIFEVRKPEDTTSKRNNRLENC